MKKHLLSIFSCAILFAPNAFAALGHAEIFARCEDEHKRGVCRARLDRKHYPPNATLFVVGKGYVSLEPYLRIRNAGKQMCTLARYYCLTKPTGEECGVAQDLWAKQGE